MGLGQTIRVMQESMAEKKDSKGKGETTEGFVVTKTDRCDHLASRLAPNEANLKAYIKELNLFKPRAQELFNSVKTVLSANTPMPVDVTPIDSPGAPASLDAVVGTNSMSRLDTTVILPIERWLAEYHTLKTDRLPVMEKTRLELDSRRRQELELIEEVEGLRIAEQPTDAAKLDKHNRKYEERAHLLAHKQTKMHAVNKTFIDQEVAVHQHLRALTEDAELIPEYMAEGLIYFQDMFGRALESFSHGSRGIPPTTALERSNHNELWKEANTPNVPIPVLPTAVPATTMSTTPAQFPTSQASPGLFPTSQAHTGVNPIQPIPFDQAHTPAAADVASDNHGMFRDITKDRPFHDTNVPQQPYHASVPPTRQYEVEAPLQENVSTLPFRDQPTFVQQAPAHHEAVPFVNEPAPFANQSTMPSAYQSHTTLSPTPQYNNDMQLGAASPAGGLPRTGQMEYGATAPAGHVQHTTSSPTPQYNN